MTVSETEHLPTEAHTDPYEAASPIAEASAVTHASRGQGHFQEAAFPHDTLVNIRRIAACLIVLVPTVTWNSCVTRRWLNQVILSVASALAGSVDEDSAIAGGRAPVIL